MDLAVQTAAAKTISSLDLLGMVNQVRAEEGGRVALRHDHFLAKIEKELGEAAPKFRGSYQGADNTSRSCYYLPEREACLVVMSESPKVRAMVYDRMRSLENKLSADLTSGQEWISKLLAEQKALTELMSGNVVMLGSSMNILSDKVENVRSDVSEIKDRITILESRRPRREIKDSVKSDHYLCLEHMGWRCPITHEPITMSDVEFDHFFSNHQPDFKHTWPLSKSAHAKLTHGKMSRVEVRSAFDAYQCFAERVMPKQLGLFK